MKALLMNVASLLLVFIFSSTFSTTVLGQSVQFIDGTETHGGDSYAAAFQLILRDYVQILPRTYTFSSGESFTKEQLIVKSQAVLIKSEDQVFLGDRELAAINQPNSNPPLVVISRSFWDRSSEDQRRLLVLHEALPLLGILDADYVKSTLLFSSFKNPTTPLAKGDIRQAIMNCDVSTLSQISELNFKSSFAGEELTKVIFHAVYNYCSYAIDKFAQWKINMNVCPAGAKYTPLFALFVQPEESPAFIETLIALKEAGAENVHTCADETTDICLKILKSREDVRPRARQILGCSN